MAIVEIKIDLRIKGMAKVEIDPAAPENSVITDLDKAPRNAHGMVEYENDRRETAIAGRVRRIGALRSDSLE